MQQDNRVNFQDLDQVLLSAQRRRSADIGLLAQAIFQGTPSSSHAKAEPDEYEYNISPERQLIPSVRRRQ